MSSHTDNRVYTGAKRGVRWIRGVSSERLEALSLLPGWALVIASLVGSLVILLLYSFLENPPPSGVYEYTLQNYRDMLDMTYLKQFWRSLWIGVKATVICTIIAYPVAYYLAQSTWRYKNIVVLAILAPLWVNLVIKAYAWQLILGRGGLLNYLLVDILQVRAETQEFLFTETAVLIGLVYNLLPFAIVPLYTAIRRFDHSQIEAAKNLGANRFVTFFTVVFPQTLSGLAAGGLFVFILAFGAFPTPEILGGRQNLMIGNIMGRMFRGINNWGLGAAMAVLFTLIVVAVVALVGRFAGLQSAVGSSSGESSASRSGRSIQVPTRVLTAVNSIRISDRLARNSLRTTLVAVMLFIYIPIIVVVILSFSPTQFPKFPMEGFSLEWYDKLIPPNHEERLLDGLFTSLKLGIMAAVGAAILGTLAVFGMIKGRFSNVLFKRNVLSVAFVLPMVIPWIVTGVAMLTLFSMLGIQGTYLSLLFGHIFLTIPFVFTVVAAQYDTIDESLEEAAQNLGASRLQTFRKITLPLLAPGIIAGSLFAFSISFDNFTQSFFWSGTGTQTLPIIIYSRLQFGIEPTINAIGTVIIVISLVMAVSGEKIAARYF